MASRFFSNDQLVTNVNYAPFRGLVRGALMHRARLSQESTEVLHENERMAVAAMFLNEVDRDRYVTQAAWIAAEDDAVYTMVWGTTSTSNPSGWTDGPIAAVIDAHWDRIVNVPRGWLPEYGPKWQEGQPIPVVETEPEEPPV